MSTLKLTKTRMLEGMWQGIISGSGDDKPDIAVTHDNVNVPDFKLVKSDTADHWSLTIPVPATVLIGDDVTNIDQRAELELLRSELEMLKRAFRRHCIETT